MTGAEPSRTNCNNNPPPECAMHIFSCTQPPESQTAQERDPGRHELVASWVTPYISTPKTNLESILYLFRHALISAVV